MPKKNKPAAPNAFYYFMCDFKNKQGRKFSDMSQVAAEASPHWSRMSKAEKKPYEDKAKAEKGTRGKLTSDGVDADTLVAMQRRAQAMREEMREDIDHTIKVACQVGGIRQHQFFLIHVNLLLPNPVREVYYPCEIAASVFTLQDGVENVYHKLVQPGDLPLGYACEAKIYAQNCHQLYNTSNEPCTDNVEESYMELTKFLKENFRGSSRMPILYTDDRIIDMVRDVLDSWSHEFGDGPIFKVYSLQYMLRVLKNTCVGANCWFSDTPAISTVEKDMYCFTPGICCDFHDTTDAVQYCSRSFVVRYAYTVCDICCGDLNIHLVPGFHIPAKCKLASAKGSSSSSYNSSRSSISDADDSVSITSSSDTRSEWDNESVCSTSTLDENFEEVRSNRRNKSFTGRMSSRPPALPSFSQCDMDSAPRGAWSASARGNYTRGVVSREEYPALGRGRNVNQRSDTTSSGAESQGSSFNGGDRGFSSAVRGKRIR